MEPKDRYQQLPCIDSLMKCPFLCALGYVAEAIVPFVHVCTFLFFWCDQVTNCIGPIQCFYFCFISEGNTKKKPTWWDIMHLISSMSEVSRNLPTVHINFALWKLINIFICAHFEPIFICAPSVLLSPSNVTDARNLVLHAA